MMYKWHYLSPYGDMVMTGNDSAVTTLSFTGQRYSPALLDENFLEAKTDEFSKVIQYLDEYFQGKIPLIKPKLELHTTPFRQRVYEILRTIAYGKSITYGEIASILSEKFHLEAMSAQAIGNAVGHNPVCILIPCHRVLGSHRAITGYAAGLDIKRKLLSLEGIDWTEKQHD